MAKCRRTTIKPTSSLLLLCWCFLAVAVNDAQSQVTDCVVPDTRAGGSCTPILECRPLMRLLASSPKPLSLEVSDYLRSLHCGSDFVNNLPVVCCTLEDIAGIATTNITTTTDATDTVTPTVAPPTNSQNVTTSTLLIKIRGDGDEPAESVVSHANLRLLPLDDCGPLLTQKISNGNDTELREYPWMALLQYTDPNTGELQFMCGGTLINDRYVLTAAHCVTGLRPGVRLVSVRLGEFDIASPVDCQVVDGDQDCAEPVQDIPVAEVIHHADFNRPRYTSDIALVRLSRSANLGFDSVQPICLPVTEEIQAALPKIVTITGWGLTTAQVASNRLQQASLPTVTNAVCQEMYRAVRLNVRVYATQMCAGGVRGVDSCKGDSGGPLVYPAHVRTAQMVQYGIISLGVDKCRDETITPGLYTRVPHFMRWILDNMRD